MDVVRAESPVPQLLMSSGTDLTVEGAVEGNPTAEELDICPPKWLMYDSAADHACYLELHEEVEVEHINSVWPVFLFEQLYLQLFPKNPQSKPHFGL